MSFKTEIINTDVTERVVEVTRSQARIDDVAGILAQARNYVIQDDDGSISSFNNIGLLARNPWRATDIFQNNENGERIFTGQIESTGTIIDQGGFTATVAAREPTSVFLEFPVDENDSITFAGFTVSGAHVSGDSTITVTAPGGVIVTIPALVTFDASLVPRFQIIDQVDNGSETTSITLDRGIQEAFAGAEAIRITIPIIQTAPAALKSVLQSVGLSARLGSSFDTLNLSDISDAAFFWIHTLQEQQIPLKKYVATLLDLSDLGLTLSNSGIIDIVRGRVWDGQTITSKITGAETIPPTRLSWDVSRLVIGTSLLYRQPSGAVTSAAGQVVKSFEEEVDAAIVSKWAGVKRWKPLQPKDTFVMSYNILFASQTSASFFSARRLDYYGKPRVNIDTAIKPFRHDQVQNKITPQLFKQFALSMPVSVTRTLVNEPSICIGFTEAPDGMSFNVTLQLTNWPSPNIPRASDIVETPEVVTLFDVDSGFAVLFFGIITAQIKAEVFFVDKVSRLFDTLLVTATSPAGTYAAFTNAALVNGTEYFVRFRAFSDPFESDRTDFISFTPEVDTGEYNNSTYNTDSYSVGDES